MKRISSRRPILLMLALSMIVSSYAPTSSGSQKRDEPKMLKLSLVMRKAADAYPSVLAGRKKIEAAKQGRTGVLLDQLSLTGSITRQTIDGRAGADGVQFPTQQKMSSESIGVQLMLSLTTWFQAQGLHLDGELAKASLTALRMQLATDAAEAYGNFYNSNARLSYLKVFKNSLEKLSKEISDGRLKVRPVNRELLSSKLADINAAIRTVETQKAIAAADIENLWGEQPGSIENEDSGGQRSVESSKQTAKDWSGVDWATVDKMFPVPENAKIAFENSARSPVLIQSTIGEKQARNQWYLTAAKSTPHIVFKFEKAKSSSEITALHSKQTMSGTSFTVSAGFNIGAGSLHNLSAASLLEEAAQYNHQATQKQIYTGFQKLYPVLSQTKEQIQFIESFLKTAIPAYYEAKTDSDKGLSEYIQLISSLDQAMFQIAEQMNSYLLTRVRIHGMMGTLLEEIDHLQEIGL